MRTVVTIALVGFPLGMMIVGFLLQRMRSAKRSLRTAYETGRPMRNAETRRAKNAMIGKFWTIAYGITAIAAAALCILCWQTLTYGWLLWLIPEAAIALFPVLFAQNRIRKIATMRQG